MNCYPAVISECIEFHRYNLEVTKPLKLNISETINEYM